MKKILLLFTGLILIGGSLLSSNFVVVIDPGHGGRDPGSLRGSIKEKEINLAVALELGKLIESNAPDVKVVYTRKTDVFVPLEKRTKIANQNKANLFISIHTNSTSATTTRAVGADTYILGLARSAENLAVAKRENSVIKFEDDYTTKYEGFDPDSPESYIIFEFMTNHHMQQSLDVASHIQSAFKQEAKRVDRGVRQAGFLVLRESGMPSILIELGFINNPVEAKYLNSTNGQKSMAAAIYNGFKKYKDTFDKVDYSSAPKKNVIAERQPASQGTDNMNNIPRTAVNTTNNRPANTQQQTAPQSNRGTTTSQQTVSSNTGIPANAIEYRVQFLYSQTKLEDNSPRFKGMEDVSYYVDNGYKYTVGSTTDYNEIRRLFRQVQTKFSDAFIIRMKNGKRVLN